MPLVKYKIYELSARAAMELHLKHVIHALGMETDP